MVVVEGVGSIWLPGNGDIGAADSLSARVGGLEALGIVAGEKLVPQ